MRLRPSVCSRGFGPVFYFFYLDILRELDSSDLAGKVMLQPAKITIYGIILGLHFF